MCVCVCVKQCYGKVNFTQAPKKCYCETTTFVTIPWLNCNTANGDLRLLWCVDEKIDHSKQLDAEFAG